MARTPANVESSARQRKRFHGSGRFEPRLSSIGRKAGPHAHGARSKLPPVRRPCFPSDTENGVVGSAGIPRLHLFPEIPEQMVAVHVGSEKVCDRSDTTEPMLLNRRNAASSKRSTDAGLSVWKGDHHEED